MIPDRAFLRVLDEWGGGLVPGPGEGGIPMKVKTKVKAGGFAWND